MTGIKVVDDIRVNWAIADAKRDEGKQTPSDIVRFDNISYGPNGAENLLDIYKQRSANGLCPTIVNIHGGGWVYGCKEIYQYYCMNLAQHGFTVVNINYRIAPENLFPAAPEDINAALQFIEKHGSEYGIDKDRLVMVGDSAGGQLVSHYAAILTNPDFAKLFDFALPNVTVRALGLNCGAYDGRSMLESGSDEVFNIYAGTTNQAPTEKLLQMLDTCSNITEKFPPSFVMSAECDFLLPAAKPMYELISGHGVPAVLKIYGDKSRPEIGHVFHVDINLPEATVCNDAECEFFKKYTT